MGRQIAGQFVFGKDLDIYHSGLLHLRAQKSRKVIRSHHSEIQTIREGIRPVGHSDGATVNYLLTNSLRPFSATGLTKVRAGFGLTSIISPGLNGLGR